MNLTQLGFMKRLRWTQLCVTMITAALLGCGGSRQVDTSQLEKSFQTAEVGTKSDVNEAVSGIKNGEFDKAVSSLKKVVQASELSEAQKDAISGVVTNMQMVVTRHPKTYSVE